MPHTAFSCFSSRGPYQHSVALDTIGRIDFTSRHRCLDTHTGMVVSLLIFRIRCLFFPKVQDSIWNSGYLLERYLENWFRLQLYFARDTYGDSFFVSSLPSYHKRALSKRLCNTSRLSTCFTCSGSFELQYLLRRAR